MVRGRGNAVPAPRTRRSPVTLALFSEDLGLLGRELLVGEDPRIVQFTELLELLHRVLFLHGRGSFRGGLGGPLFFFLPGPPTLLAMLHGPGRTAGDGTHGGYTRDAAK